MLALLIPLALAQPVPSAPPPVATQRSAPPPASPSGVSSAPPPPGPLAPGEPLPTLRPGSQTADHRALVSGLAALVALASLVGLALDARRGGR